MERVEPIFDSVHRERPLRKCLKGEKPACDKWGGPGSSRWGQADPREDNQHDWGRGTAGYAEVSGGKQFVFF